MYILARGLRDGAKTSGIRPGPIGNFGEARADNKFNQCGVPERNAIQAAFVNAQRALNNAAAILGSAYAKPDRMTRETRALLNRHFHTTNRGDIFKIFRTIFRIQQAFEKGLRFECETQCQRGTKRPCGYAWATQWFGGRGDIHVCFDNRPTYCTFAKLNASDTAMNARAQAALIIHEAAHRHVGIPDKAYLWERTPPDPRDYTALTAKEAINNADSYAWFCVDLYHELSTG